MLIKTLVGRPATAASLCFMQLASCIDYKSLYEQQKSQNNELRLAVTALQQQLAQLQKMIFGSRHERFVPGDANPSQLTLGIEAETAGSCNIAEAKKISYVKTSCLVEQKPLVHPGRMKLPEHLRRDHHRTK